MIKPLSSFSKTNYRILFSGLLVLAILILSLNQSYILFHTIIELLSIIVAFTVFVVTWNAKKVLENQYLYFVGIAYLFIGGLDLLHTLSYPGLNIIAGKSFFANQFWVATRGFEALILALGFYFLNSKKKINADLLFLSYLIISILITLSILHWRIFPVCFIEGQGLTPFKIISEYVIIGILCLAGYFLFKGKRFFDPKIYKLLVYSLVFTAISEFCFTLYLKTDGGITAVGHLFKLVSFYLIYKANVETSFTKPTTLLFNGIKESEFRYRTLANNLPVLIFRFNQELSCTYTNAQERATDTALLNQLMAEIEQFLIKAKESRHPVKGDITLSVDDEKLNYSLDLILENQQSRSGEHSYLVLCQDITMLKLAEQKLMELNATKDKFFSIIAHDLKNPFTTILASNELIHKNAPKLAIEKVQNLAFRSHEAAKSAYSLLENLLSWAMIQTGALKPNPQKVEVDGLINNVVKTMLPVASIKGIQITAPQETNLLSFADSNMVDTILRNIISNAIKFSLPETFISIYAGEEDNCIKFSVTDQGVGIDEKSLKDLLANNSVVSKDGTAKEKGTGLGLQLCKDFILLNKGRFNIISTKGNGSTFEFWLPKFK